MGAPDPLDTSVQAQCVLPTVLCKHRTALETFCLCLFESAVPISQALLIFIGKEVINPPSTRLLLQAHQSKAEKIQ